MLSTLLADTDISDLAVEDIDRHLDQGIIGQAVPLFLGAIGLVPIVIYVLLREDKTYLEFFLKEIKNQFGQKNAVFLTPQKSTVGRIGKMDMEFVASLSGGIRSLQILGHPNLPVFHIFGEGKPVPSHIPFMSMDLKDRVGSAGGAVRGSRCSI